MPPPPTFTVALASARPLSPSVRALTFERTDGAPLAFEAGELRRSYSIASEPNGTPRFELAVTHVAQGPGSSFLHALAPGAALTAIGPAGFFTRPLAHAAPSILVATGTGVTPFRSMLRAAIAAGNTTPMWLLFGVRQEGDILYRDELESMAASHPHLHVEVTLSRPHEGWSGRHGYVQTHLRELLESLAARTSTEPHVYVCGLTKMVSSVRELLRKDMSLPRERVHTERYD